MSEFKKDGVELNDGLAIAATEGVIGVTHDGRIVEGYCTEVKDIYNEDKFHLALAMIERWTAVLKDSLR